MEYPYPQYGASYKPLLVSLGLVIALSTCLSLAFWLFEWTEKIQWLLDGPSLLATKYCTGRSFAIRTPERSYTLVSSAHHIRELSQAKEDVLSLVATAEEVFQPAFTMNGVELHRLGMQHRILRTMSLSLPQLQEPLTSLVKGAIWRSLEPRHEGSFMDATKVSLSDPLISPWKSVSIFDLAQTAIGKANTYTFYGAQFVSDEVFLRAALQYPRDVFMAAEAIRCVPTWLAPTLSWLVTRGHRASKILISKLLPVFEKRLETGLRPSDLDYIQHIIDVFPEESSDAASKMVKQTLALWFASLHQPAIALYNAIVDLCLHVEHQMPLQKEIEANIQMYGHLNTSRLPLMDSFLKESARMNASESISLRRKAKEDFTFQDGLKISKGDWVCIPQREIMHDSTIYPDAARFKGFRFAEDHENNPHSTKNARFTDIHTYYTLWGLGRHACPGRFYASFVVKLVLSTLLQDYDIRITSLAARRHFKWRSSILPFPGVQFEIREKQKNVA